MSDTPTPPPAVEPSGGGGFFQNLADLYFAPRQAFSRIVVRPAFVLPFVGQLVLAFAFTGIWLNKMEPREFMKTQLEEAGRWDKLNTEQREAVLSAAPTQMKIFGWLGPAIGTPVMLLLTGGVLMFVFRFFFSSEVGFRQSLAIVAWSLFAVGLVTTPLMLLVFQLKGDWNLNPQDVLQANLGLLVDKASVAKPLWALLTSIDLFSFWTVFLLAVGFAVASRKTTGSGIWGVAVPWAVLVLIKIGWTALMG
ncbi:MAG TPA: YIP1 family protein [Vicinamibacteria bacterium]|nr:YIP1 family protein [Vicinamibacteria bacterium]